MVNTSNIVVNIHELNEYTTISTGEDNQIKLAQQNLKKLNENTVLPEKMLKSAMEAWSKSGHIMSSMARTINDYCVSSSNNGLGENMKEYLNEINFVSSIKCYDDFCTAVILKEDINSVWIVIKDASFSNNKKYLNDARIFKNDNDIDFNIIIFDQEQLEGMKEQLTSYEYYEVMEKDAK